ncbi:hypothetical protein B566_EDAN006812 [Ephemera danica]|nr:hypothetical protein B566_EDAN006812 [Ephemera danica]
MAFLCPVRIRRGKKKKKSRQEGFIPHSYCTPYGSHLGDLALNNVKKKLPRDVKSHLDSSSPDDSALRSMGNLSSPQSGVQDLSDSESYGMANKKTGTTQATSHQHQQQQQQQQIICGSQASLHSMSSSQPDVHPFFKDPAGRYIVLYTFIARDENDVSVERGEFVTVLNREDPDWYWIVRSDGQEGFVPSGFVYPADVIQGHLSQGGVVQQNSSFPSPTSPHHMSSPSSDELRYHGTELVMLYDYKAQAPDDLTVRRGDWIYADLANQTVDGWLWAYAPKTRKYGFIPKAYARPPAMTSLCHCASKSSDSESLVPLSQSDTIPQHDSQLRANKNNGSGLSFTPGDLLVSHVHHCEVALAV